MAANYHIFAEKNFRGFVYCDYCSKLLWGLAKQGVQCKKCGYSCHISCSDKVVQCRTFRRWSPDSLSMTDSEPDSISRHSANKSLRPSLDSLRYLEEEGSTDRKSKTAITLYDDALSRSFKSPEEPLKSPSLLSNNKAYRKSLKQQLQKSKAYIDMDAVSPQATAKAFTRLVARSRAFFSLVTLFNEIYYWKSALRSLSICFLWTSICLYPQTLVFIPPLTVFWLCKRVGLKPYLQASFVLTPRYDEKTPEYCANLEQMQQAFVFFIRLYDNLAYHLNHISLDSFTYKILFILSLCVSTVFYYFGRNLLLLSGLLILLNKTWVGSTLETLLLFTIELLQTVIDISNRLDYRRTASQKKTIEVSVYENQRWWAGVGYTSQMLRTERASWSNITGLEPVPFKEDIPSPTSYMWIKEEEWALDTTGPWIDDRLGIVVNHFVVLKKRN
ncbi:hypothetical protein BY458DRAFT_499870 [Sporodiniella umbellata]|nr:hypothetical protein BY458DRAFT_499870 [Sporodiniella umbellata]